MTQHLRTVRAGIAAALFIVATALAVYVGTCSSSTAPSMTTARGDGRKTEARSSGESDSEGETLTRSPIDTESESPNPANEAAQDPPPNQAWVDHFDPNLTLSDYLSRVIVEDPVLNGTHRRNLTKNAGSFESSKAYNPTGKSLTPSQSDELNRRLQPLNDRIQRLADESIGLRSDALVRSMEEGRFAATSDDPATGRMSLDQLKRDLESLYGEFGIEWIWITHSDERFGRSAVWFARQHAPDFFARWDEQGQLVDERRALAADYIENLR